MSADFDEVQFPNKIAYGAKGGPRYKTTVITTESGYEQRIQHWTNGRGFWNVSSGVKSNDQRDVLNAFFRARKGKLRGFRLKDWDDYKVDVAAPTLQISSTQFQLAKYYTSGDQTETRKIRKPVANTVKIYNGSTRVLTGFTIDHTTGVVTFTAAPGYIPSATFEFDVPVRFDTDGADNVRSGFAINNWDDIPIIEIMV